MFCSFISEDIQHFPNQSIKSRVLPYQPFADFCKVLTDPSYDQNSHPLDTNFIKNMRYTELDDDKLPFPQNSTLPPEMPHLHPMDVDVIESDQHPEKNIPILQEERIPSNDEDLIFEEVLPDDDDICLKIPCLQTIENLQRLCEEKGLKFNICTDAESSSGESSNKTFEVDIICDHKIEEGEIYYNIKWKNYSTESNTWEPLWHLEGCGEMIEYYNVVCFKRSKQQITENVLAYFVRDLISRKPHDILTMIKLCALCSGTTEKYVRSLNLTMSEMKSKVKQILTYSEKKINKIENELFRIMQFGEKRKQVLINLKEWEIFINEDIPGSYVTVENDVDLEKAPSEFIFIHDYINTVSPRPSEIVTFCSCEDCYKEKDACCPNDSEAKFAYNRHKKLILDPGYPIFECNDRCKCPNTCINRVVQNGQKVKVAIFRTPRKGWGLKTLENIEKGQFVLEYLGEIITSELAEERGRQYDYVAGSYLFDLDYGIDTTCCYTVDAGHVGNVAHFINHSCDPNLHVFAVWINEQDPRLPRLAFFARRRIQRGEELTFDYKMSKDHSSGDSSPEQTSRILCRCNAKKCRKYLF